ncbi:MAG: NADH-quinone oxidoreductase subunit N [Candidatus Omnitrophota bacterium]|nr:NADH-quinone oxidoreductase subunit N [Candidatus Omnitrophota bacterium]
MSAIESVRYILPEIILTGFALASLILGLFIKKKGFLGALCLAGILLAVLSLQESYKAASPLFSGMLLNDSFSEFFKEISLLVAGLIILISMGYRPFSGEDSGEYYFLLLTVAVAMMFAVSSNNLIMIYIALEAVSLISYILVGFLKRDVLSSEGALKYFLFGALSTGIMLYGISFIYGLFGTTDLSAISAALEAGDVNNFTAFISLVLILAGLCFKCALVPFHMWVPDAYQGAPTPIAAFISSGPKAIGFAILIRIFLKNFFPLFPNWVDIITVISILTMTAGNLIAISQDNIKRMLGYSSIAQAGYILIGFAVGTPLGVEGSLLYILAYVLMNLGAFGCVVLVSNSIKSDEIKDYAGLYKKDPAIAFMLTLFLLSLAGIPPLAGFLGKFLVFAAAIESRFILLAVAGVINSVVALYYYVRVVKFMYLDEPRTFEAQPRPISLQIALIVALAGILIVGLFPLPFLDWIAASLL